MWNLLIKKNPDPLLGYFCLTLILALCGLIHGLWAGVDFSAIFSVLPPIGIRSWPIAVGQRPDRHPETWRAIRILPHHSRLSCFRCCLQCDISGQILRTHHPFGHRSGGCRRIPLVVSPRHQHFRQSRSTWICTYSHVGIGNLFDCGRTYHGDHRTAGFAFRSRNHHRPRIRLALV